MKSVFIILLMIFSFGCSKTVINSENKFHLDNSKIAVGNFSNNTESLFAGKKVKNILFALLLANNKNVVNLNDSANVEAIKVVKNLTDADYLITGSVNEWRYQTGVDGKPAINVTLYIYDTKTDRVVWSGVVSRAGTVYETLGIVAQKSLNAIIKGL